jgi:hypothetical protein
VTKDFCEFEEILKAALANGEWNEGLEEHVAACSQCADCLLVSKYFAEAANAAEPAFNLPAPGLIWWRAQLAERHEHAARAVAAIDLMQKLATAIALAAVVVCLFLWGPVDRNFLLMALGLLISTAALLYGWIRGRI